jgi:hypothetical protein
MVAAVVVLALRGWLALQGCADGGDQLLPSPAELVDGSGVVGFEPLAGAGSAPYRAQIRSYNAWGASVPADEVDVEIDGESRPLLLDDLGYGGATIGAGGVHSVAVDGVEVDVHVFRNEWPGIGGSPAAVVAPIPEPVEIYGVTDGVVGRVANELWFAGDLTPAHRVLAADADLQGARAVQVDVDGRTDLVAWTTNQVFVLRGHPGGGLGWGVSFRAPGYTIASVDVGDVSGDNLPDLVFAWVTPEGAGVLDVWEASGLFEFEAAEPRNIPGKPVSVTAGDANGDGVGQATVLHEDGTWSRYLRGAEKQYIPVGPTLPPVLALPAGATLERCGDVNGDAADEITIAGPYDPAAQRSFWFMDVSLDALECAAGLTGVQCLTEYVQIEDLTGGEAACADADANGVDEMWLWDRLAGLRVYRHDLFSDLFLTSSIEHPFGTGVFDVSDRNGDRIGDPIVADDRVWSQWLGEPPSEATGIWSVRSELTVRVREDVISPFARAETDGDDGTLEWVTTLSNASGTYLRLVQYLPLGDGAALIGDIRLDDRGEIPTDVAVCGTDVYVAIGGEVVHASILDPLDPVVVDRAGAAIVHVDCGEGPDGVGVLTVDAAGLAEARSPSLAVTSTAAGSFGDAVFADLGAGPQVVGCAAVGCGVAAWDTGAGVAVVEGTSDALTVALAGGPAEVIPGGAGVPSVVDLDQDGRPDLAAWDGARRRLTVVRSTGEGVAPPSFVNLAGDYDHVTWTDGDADGWPDLFGSDADDRLVHTVLTAPPEPTTPTTGGT